MHDLYGDKYGEGPFVPDKIREASEKAHQAKLTGASLIYDKNATPAESVEGVQNLERTLRPLSLVANRSSKGATVTHEEHGNVLARYQNIEIQSGSTMMDQFHALYLGPAHPYTLPVAVGGYDVPRRARWRRPEKIVSHATPLTSAPDRHLPLPLSDSFFAQQNQVTPPTVKLYDITRSLPLCME